MKSRMCAWLLLGLWVVLPLQAQDSRTIKGKISDDRPYTELLVAVTQPNTTLTLDLQSTSGDLDTLLYLVDQEGNIVSENDDRVRGNPDALIVFPFAPVGQYRVVATRYGIGDGDTVGEFVLNMQQTPSQPIQETYDVSPQALDAQGFPKLAPRPRAKWTVIVYYGADNNLEQGLLQDMKEFENAGGSNQDVRIIVLMDRSRSNFVSPMRSQEWSSAKIFEVQSNRKPDGSLIQPDDDVYISTELADLGANPLGASGQLLAQYLIWAAQTFPADRYAIAFGSHGAGWEGLLQDDTPTENDDPTNDNSKFNVPENVALMSIPQLQRALRTVQRATQIERFDVLINDACSMSSIEYLSSMSEFFDLSLASPEIVVNPALDMGLLTQLLNQRTDLIATSKQLVDRYIDTDILAYDTPDIAYLNHAVTDLTQFGAVRQTVEAFAKLFNSNPKWYAPALSKARMDDSTYVYSSFLGSDTKIDLGDLMRNVVRHSNTPELANAALAVIEALDKARVYGKNGGAPQLEKASYYNIYFPSDRDDFRGSEYLNRAEFAEWGLLLRNYFNVSNPDLATITNTPPNDFHAPVAPHIRISNFFPLDGAVSVQSPIVIEGEIVGRNIDQAQVTIDQRQADGTFVRLSTEPFLLDVPTDKGIVRVNRWESGVDIRDITWDVTLPQIRGVDAQGQAITSFEYLSFTAQVATLNGAYREPNGASWHDVTIVFDNIADDSTHEGLVQRVLSNSTTSEALGNINIPLGSEFVAYRPRVTADGITVLERSPMVWIWDETAIRYAFAPAPNGEYQIGILATAVGGSTGFAKRDVRVDNANANVDLRADTAPFAGFTLARPLGWQRMVYSDGFTGACEVSTFAPALLEAYRITSPQSPSFANLSVYLLPQLISDTGEVVALSDPQSQDDILKQLALAEVRVTSELKATTFGDKVAFAVSYEYDSVDGTMTGTGYLVENGYSGTIELFGAEALTGEDGVLSELDALLQTTRLFDVNRVLESQERTWGFSGSPDYSIALYGTDFDDPYYLTTDVYDETMQRYVSTNGDIRVQINRQTADNRATIAGIARDLAEQGTQDFEITTIQLLLSPSVGWEALTYEAIRDGERVQGRVYRAFENDAMFTLWFELPIDAQTPELIRTILEPLVDSVVFYSATCDTP
jgi:hypothetical protein